MPTFESFVIKKGLSVPDFVNVKNRMSNIILHGKSESPCQVLRLSMNSSCEGSICSNIKFPAIFVCEVFFYKASSSSIWRISIVLKQNYDFF